MYTYKIDGVEIDAKANGHGGSGILYAALGVAAVIAFQQVKPVVVEFQGRPYRRVSVDFIDQMQRAERN